ncbi:MAG: hypothetical protein M0P71_06330 [Melioribacteraceae bacterium]|nr:hypothetical protein [Melioribacteraceae bacterium]
MFINPVEVLALDSEEISNITPDKIKKAKRKLIAEIELSNEGFVIIDGNEITMTGVDSFANKVFEIDILKHYHNISKNKPLSNFLKSRDVSLFHSYINFNYYNDPSFINLISIPFAYQFNIALFNAFKNRNIDEIKKLTIIKPLVNDNDMDKCYQSIYDYINIQINTINDLSKKIETDTNLFNENNIKQITNRIRAQLNPILLKYLPVYYNQIINRIALTIRSLSVLICNQLDYYENGLDLIKLALEYNVNSVNKNKLQEDYKKVYELVKENKEDKANEGMYSTYGKLLIEIKNKIELIRNGRVNINEFKIWIDNTISITEINNLDNKYVEIKNQIVLGLKMLSIEIWNETKNIQVATYLLEKANLITGISIELKKQILQNRTQLQNIRIQLGSMANSYRKSNDSSLIKHNIKDKKGDRDFIKLIVIIVSSIIFILLILAISRHFQRPRTVYNNKYKSESQYNSESEYDFKTEYDSKSDNSAMDNNTYYSSLYKDNQLKNGDSPYDKYFGKGVFHYSKNNYIIFENSKAYDVIVCLVNVNSEQTIRNNYIRAGYNYKMGNIPNGVYYIKAFYGKDWNPNKKINNGSIIGGFDTAATFSKSEKFSDRINLMDDGEQYSTYTITLYSVQNGNMSQENISAKEFF